LQKETLLVAKIKKFEDDCAILCEESAKVWEEIMEYLEMKVVEAKLREAQGWENEASKKASTLPLV